MPSPAINGSRVPLNLGTKFAGQGNRLLLNLGVEDGGGPPPDPVEVVGLLTSAARVRWGHGSLERKALRGAWGGLAARERSTHVVWGGQQGVSRATVSRWSPPAAVVAQTHVSWRGAMLAVVQRAASRWSVPPELSAAVRGRWREMAAGLSAQLGVPWLSPPHHHAGFSASWQGAGLRTGVNARVAWLAPPKLHTHWDMPWGVGRGLDWLVRPVPSPQPEEPEQPQDASRIGLNLGCRVFDGPRNRLPLNLGVTECYLSRRQQRTYIVLNQIEVVRLPDRLPIHVDAVSLESVRGGWCWGARLSLADPAQLSELQPTVAGPRSVEITLNGYQWVIAIEAFDQTREFGATGVSLSGRSVTAQLAEPYAAARTREAPLQRTMVQLADEEVAGGGITVDYGTVSWLVPGGAWYYQGLTPMAALLRIADASGGVVQSHPSLPVVQIRAAYPVSPWEWPTTTPDTVIQDDILTGVRLQLQSRPMHDAVIVSGERVGVSARVKRAGEAGQTYAEQQVDQLITHADGARERGRNVLCDRGGQASVEHDLPLFPAPLQAGQPGLVLPLSLVQRVASEGTWHGLATGVRIEARRQDKAVDIVQTVTLERHYTDAD